MQVCGLIIVGNEAQNHSIISKFDNRSGAVRGHTVVCVERVEQGAQDPQGEELSFWLFRGRHFNKTLKIRCFDVLSGKGFNY